jgi:hypothetical protein
MARKASKAEAQFIILAVIVGLPIYVLYESGEALGWNVIFVGIIVVIIFSVLVKIMSKKARRAKLMEKYNNDQLVDAIMRQSFWIGQTKEQLVDSLGNPQDIDEKVLKTKTKEIWKYNHSGGNRYGLRITIENGEVIGWDKKD